MAIKKSFSKKRTKRTTIKLSPKEADEVIRQEFKDSRGNRHIFRMDINPHSPDTPTIEGNIEYKDNK